MTILEGLAGYLSTLTLDGMAADDRIILQNHVIDTIGASLAGAHTPDGEAVLDFSAGRALSARRPAAPDPLDTLAARVAATRSSELDDIHMASCTTPGSIVLPAALTVAECRPDIGGHDLGAAILSGYEAMTRLGTAIGGAAAVYRGLWPTYFCAPFAVAATIGRVIGLAPDRMTHALAMALATATGGAGRPRGAIGSRWLLVGNAARNGVLAALAAAEGFAGDPTLLDGDWLAETHGISGDMRSVIAVDATPVLHTLSLKPWCAAKQAMAAIQGMREILAGGVDPAAIRAVRVGVPPAFAKMIGNTAIDGVRVSALTSAGYQMALAAFQPEGLYDVARARLSDDSRVAALARKITVEPDDDLAEHWPARYPARVRVEAESGTHEALVLDVPGDPGNRLDRDGVLAKFRRFTDVIADRTTQDALIAAADAAFDEGGPVALAEAYGRLFAGGRR